MSGQYIVWTGVGYFNWNDGPYGDYYLSVRDNIVYAIAPGGDIIKSLEKTTNMERLDRALKDDRWKSFISIKDMKMYIFQCELDKSLSNSK